MNSLSYRVVVSLVVTLFVLTSGCASRISRLDLRVTPFYQELPEQGKTFFVAPVDKTKIDSPEFFTYAGLVGQELEKYGLRLEKERKPADYAVMLGYGIDEGKESLSSYNTYGQTGGGTTYSSGNFSGNTYSSSGGSGSYSGNYSGTSFTMPTYGVTGTGTRSVTLYTRIVTIQIMKRIEPEDEGEEAKYKTIYESRGRSRGSIGEIAVVLPTMIRGLMEDFPGKSGKTDKKNLSIR